MTKQQNGLTCMACYPQTLVMRRRDDGRRAFWMVTHVLLKRFVAQHEPETSSRVYVNGSLQIQCVERNHVFHRFAALILNHREM